MLVLVLLRCLPMNILTTWRDHHPNRTRTSTRPPPLFTTAPCPYTPHTPSQFYTTLHTIPIAIEHINDIPPYPIAILHHAAHLYHVHGSATLFTPHTPSQFYTPYPIDAVTPVAPFVLKDVVCSTTTGMVAYTAMPTALFVPTSLAKVMVMRELAASV